MTCKDCYHYSCHNHWYDGFEDFDSHFNDTNVEILCPEFKDKSKIIELPCRVGDRIYRPVVDYISEETVMMITQRIYKNELVVTLHTEYSAYDLKEMGDLYFLTKSEAEQKLKELKK